MEAFEHTFSMITKLILLNYKSFRSFTLSCNEGLNIIVGDNEAGKSTILEAINLALTRRLNGRLIESELSSYLFNKTCVEEYVTAVHAGGKPDLPRIEIELYFADVAELQALRGNNNSLKEDAVGVKLTIAFDPDYATEYQELLRDPSQITTVPIEYYRPYWYSFANNSVTPKSLRVAPSYIDATTIRLQSGTDYYLTSIINDGLDAKERAGLAVSYRRLKEKFADEPAIGAINSKLAERRGGITDKDLVVGMDLSQKGAWETSLTPHLNAIPFQHIGRGDQSALKIMLALDRKAGDAQIVLIEEPENHLSFSTMSILIKRIQDKCTGKQIFAATHSAYVLNKLGLENVILLHGGATTSLKALPADTQQYFRKLPGYDTLRMILAKRAILVEGPSDELVVQKAYQRRHGRLPIQDGVDVISVRGLSFARYLDIAKELGTRVAVVTDNDGNHASRVVAKYAPYASYTHIAICADSNDDLRTLEDQMFACNDLARLNTLFGTTYGDREAMLAYMKANKTEWALAVFDTATAIDFPTYVIDAIA